MRTHRIERTFKELKKRHQKAFVVFLTAGDPSLKTTFALASRAHKIGVDLIEIGVPFSDPIADGPVIQGSSYRALCRGVALPAIFTLVRKIRQKTPVPLVLMTYYNPIFCYGLERFVRDAVMSGVDGVIVPDLPPEEAGPLLKITRKKGLSVIFLAAPTSSSDRLIKIAKVSKGFIYFVSLSGVTGSAKGVASSLDHHVAFMRRITDKPVCIGFGVKTPQEAKRAAATGDGVIVGSAVVDSLNRFGAKKTFTLIRRLARAVKGKA